MGTAVTVGPTTTSVELRGYVGKSVEKAGSGSVTLIAVVKDPTGRMDISGVEEGAAVVSELASSVLLGIGPLGVTTGSEAVEPVSLKGVGVTETVTVTVASASPVISSSHPKRRSKKSLISYSPVRFRRSCSMSSKTLSGSGLATASKAAAISEVVGTSFDRASSAHASSTW
jgi:hypothetical protein